jgi:hypothetical protein
MPSGHSSLCAAGDFYRTVVAGFHQLLGHDQFGSSRATRFSNSEVWRVLGAQTVPACLGGWAAQALATPDPIFHRSHTSGI